MSIFVDVIIPLSISQTYCYSVPENLKSAVSIGKRVVVQFGAKKFYAGVIAAIHQNPPKEYTTKDIEYILDDAPCVFEYQIKFWKWISDYYMSKLGDVMNAALPSGLKIESISKVQLNKDLAIDKEVFDQLSQNEQKVLDHLVHQHIVKIEELGKIIPKYSVPGVIKSLSEKNILFFKEEIEEKFKPKMVQYLELSTEWKHPEKLQEIIQQLEKRSFKQLEALLAYLQLSKAKSPVKKNILTERVNKAAVNALIEKGILVESLMEESRLDKDWFEKKETVLTDKQMNAFLSIKEHFKDKQTCLLYGETGSGKTEIYMEWIKEQLQQGKQCLYLVPEIALTTQLIQRLKRVFGNVVYVYHSKFSENERTEIWNKLLHFSDDIQDPAKKDNCAQIILGPRSALFLPFQNLGLIVIDEEHDASFRQRQKHPFYNARDAAIYLAHLLNTKVILGSATPSVETLYNCSIGKYGKVVLNEKYGTAKVRKKLVDIRKYYHLMQHNTLITPPLFEAMQDRLSRKEQILLFHNRRGYVPITQCLKCGWIAKCENCDVSIVYHKQHHHLLCHYCGTMRPLMQSCPACGSTNISTKGWGTEKIEEELRRLFPDYSIARMDQDTTRSKYAHKNILQNFQEQKIDILIGTQMITKGLDFANVTLVAVLYADGLLHFPDFRSFERATQLLFQLSGRAGRATKDGEMIIQTFEPQHSVLQMFLEDNYDKLYEYILNERKLHHYPPFTKLYELSIKSKDEKLSEEAANRLFAFLKPHFKEYLSGPIKPNIKKINQYYLHKILLKGLKNMPYSKINQKIQQEIEKILNSKILIDVIVDA